MTAREKLLHPATFISLIALFVALGGVGYAATKIGTKQIKDGAVTGKKLAKGSVSTSKIKAGAVGNGDLAPNSVTTSKIRPGTIFSSDLAAGSILNGDLGNGAVTGTKIANETIGTEKIENGAIASDKIGTGAVIASKLGAGSVTTPAIAPDAVTAAQIAPGQVVEGNGVLSSTSTTLTDGQTNAALLSFPGLGVLEAECSVGQALVLFVNDSGTTIDVASSGVLQDPALPVGTAFANNESVANGAAADLDTAPGAGRVGATFMASYGTGASLHLATINVSTNPVGNDCSIMAQGTYAS
jgi:trimeric autotransporter adhesin